MTENASDGGPDSRTGTGRATLADVAPEAARAYEMLVSVRPSGVHDELLEAPAVRALAEQLRVDVARVDDEQRAAFDRATGAHRLAVAEMVWISDVAPRLEAAVDALFGASQWPAPRRYPVADVRVIVEEFTRAVARLQSVDAITTELVRLQSARRHGCRLSLSRRSVAAVEAGAEDATYAALDDHQHSALPESTKAALALADAMLGAAVELPPELVARVREQLTDAEAVEVVLDVARDATSKIAVALGLDEPEVAEGVQLFVTDAEGVVSTL